MKWISSLLCLMALFCFSPILAQSNNSELPTSINEDGSDPDESAILDLQSASKGILIPRLNTAARDLIDSPATGLLIYQTDSEVGFYFFDGSDWVRLGTGDSNTTDELNISAILDGTNLEIEDAGGALVIDLSSLINDADSDPSNEVQDLSITGDLLSLTGDASPVDLSDYIDNSDEQTLSLTNNSLSISGGNSIDVSALTNDEFWQTSSGDNISNVNEGNVGIGIIAPTQNRWQLTVKDTTNCMINSDSIDVSELFAVFTRNLNENNTGIGIGFQSTSTVTGMGAAIVHERTNSNSRGKLHFATKSSGSAADEDLPIRMTLSEVGNLGIGTTSPSAKLEVIGQAVLEDVSITGLAEMGEALIGNIALGSESVDQSTSSQAGNGFTTTPWVYTNAIEAQGERGSGSTLITLGADGTYGLADEIHFVTSGNNQMEISSDGKVGIDVTPNTDIHIRQSQQSITDGTGGIKYEDSSDPTDYWRTYHSGIYYSFNLQGDRVAYVNTNGAWTQDSDSRLKKNVEVLSPILSKIKQMRPVSYHYKEETDDESKSLGFIAQEVKPLFPELVVEGEDGKYGLTYGHTGVIAIKAIQEQQAIIDVYEDRITRLEKELAEIKNLLKN